MKKIIIEEKNIDEIWFSWLTRKLDSHEAFKEFASGKSPEDVAENFVSLHKNAISKIFERFDEEDKHTFDQFQKLTECEWHVFRILKKHIDAMNKVKFVDFKKGKSKY